MMGRVQVQIGRILESDPLNLDRQHRARCSCQRLRKPSNVKLKTFKDSPKSRTYGRGFVRLGGDSIYAYGVHLVCISLQVSPRFPSNSAVLLAYFCVWTRHRPRWKPIQLQRRFQRQRLWRSEMTFSVLNLVKNVWLDTSLEQHHN